jgi:hypothetical protein
VERLLASAALALALTAAGCSTNLDHPPADDVRITDCRTDPGSGKAVVSGTATNSSSRRSNYLIWVEAAANGSKIEGGFVTVNGVDPGARGSFTIKTVGASIPAGAHLTCTLKAVSRGPSDPFGSN